MSEFAKRNARARRKSMRRWVRGLRFGGYVGAMITGLVSMWMVAAVMLA